MQPQEPSPWFSIVIFDINNQKSGIIVDEVQEVINVGHNQIDSDIGFVSGSSNISGVAKVGDQLIVIIDLAKILNLEQKELLADLTRANNALVV